jgi:hypothetical protein
MAEIRIANAIEELVRLFDPEDKSGRREAGKGPEQTVDQERKDRCGSVD